MLLTDDFVYVHMPKTGGTFVTEVISQLYERESEEPPSRPGPLRPLRRRRKRTFSETRKHGTCSEIPKPYRRKTILATVRNPYDRYVSEYEFGWWRTHPDAWNGIADRAKGIYPSYPDLSFEEFVDMANTLFPLLKNSHFDSGWSIGYQTEIFVRYFMRDPGRVFPAIDQDYLDSQRYRDDLFGRLHFIRTGNLNRELYGFLRQVGFTRREVGFVLEMDKVHPPEGGRTEDKLWMEYYTPDLRREIRTKERLLFELFPEFDI
jgi:hypothetical protein